MKLLLTGSDGQVGFELRRALAALGEVVVVNRARCDLTDSAALNDLIDAERPDVIVNAAAYTAVDRAEDDRETAAAVNTRAPGVLAQAAARLGALLVHYSTDYVFDGRKPQAYVESDPANPQSVYGRTKLEGEIAVAASGARALMLRTSWVFGVHGQNFAKTMLKLAAERDTLRVVADQFGAPTSARLTADVSAHLIRSIDREPGAAHRLGLYHLTAAGETNWHEYATQVLTRAVAAGHRLRVEPAAVEAITTQDYPTPAARPANSRLDCSRLQNAFGLHLPDWREGVDQMLEQIL